MYGHSVATRALLLGKVPVPASAQPFLAEVRAAKVQAVAAEADEKVKEKQSEVGLAKRGLARTTNCWHL